MPGCASVLLFLLLVAGLWAYGKLKQRIGASEKRLTDLALEISSLRRQLGGTRAEERGAPEMPQEAAPPEAEATEPVPEAEPAGVAPEEAATPPAPEAAPELPQAAPVEPFRPPPSRRATAAGPSPEREEPPGPTTEPVSAAGGRGAGGMLPPLPPLPSAARLQIDWERWIGVRGAAVLGGAVLALAAVLFLKFSIERGLIPPIVRVSLGVLAGLAAVGGAEVLRKRAYGAAANALSGAGIVILYASIWAAQRLYDLVPMVVAFGLMALVTAACGVLSWRHRSLVIATLGLVGGFATPLLLASGADNPIGLFGYILLLNVGLLVLSRKRGWPLLGLFSLAGTFFYQSLWFFTGFGPGRLFLALVILAVFAALFAASGGIRKPADEGQAEWRFTAIGGVFLPFAFAVYLAARADLGEHLLPLAALLLLLSAAACWLARIHAVPMVAPAAAAASVAVSGVWAARTEFNSLLVWEVVGISAALGGFFWRFGAAGVGGHRRRGPLTLEASAPLVVAAGFLLILLMSALGAETAHLWPWATGWLVLSLLLILEAGAAAGDDRRRIIPPLAAAAEVVTVGVWLVQRQVTSALAWEVVGVAVALAVFYHFAAHEPAQDEERKELPAEAVRSAPLIAAAGFFLVLAGAPQVSPASAFWPWLVAWLVLAALLVSRGGSVAHGHRQVIAAALFGLAFMGFHVGWRWIDSPPHPSVLFGLALAVAVCFQALAVLRRETGVRLEAETAAAVFPALLLLGLTIDLGSGYLSPGLFLVVGLVLAGLIALSATRIPSGPLYFGAVAGLALNQLLWTTESPVLQRAPELAGRALVLQSIAVLLCVFWPFIAGRRLAGDRWAVYGSALAGPFWFLSLKRLFELRFGSAAIGALPLLLGVVSLLAVLAARRLWAVASPRRRRSLVWYLAVTFAFVSVAIPLQLEKEWITVGWALEGLALIALWKRLDHAGLKYLALALLGAVTVRLVANPAVLGYYPRSGWPVFNWLMYTYLVPAAALVLSSRMLAGQEVERLLPWEGDLYGLLKRRPLGAIFCGVAAILVGFWWINLTVVDYFSTEATLTLSLERLPARDLTLSLSWAAYALLLLALGMARRSVGLRWLSLGFLILTIGKVFLYDLGELRDLYRVASLVGLAFSLLLVSLAYQRFVFGRDNEKEGS